jgi:hypothetical protein
MDAEIIPLKNQLEAFLAAHENHVRETGIKCNTSDCVFNSLFECLIRMVILSKGRCPHYNPKLTYSDVLPGYSPDAAPECRTE